MTNFSNTTIEAAQNGDNKAFNDLYKRLIPYVKGIIVNVSKNYYGTWIKDLAHDITAHLLSTEVLKHYDTSYNFKSWVGTIARNKCIDYFKACNKRINEYNCANLSRDNDDHFGIEMLNHKDDLTPEYALLKQEQSAYIMNLIKNNLNQDMQTIIRLWYFEELNQDEIVELTGWSHNQIGVLHYRAKQKLKDLLRRSQF